MKLVKSLLLGSAAGLCAVAGAQAADLPVRKAAPVEYVRVCTAYGAGFFFIPGTDTCLRVGGRARYEYQYSFQRNRNNSNSGFRGLGRLNIDARTQTSFGTLRAFVRFEIASRTGFYLKSGTQERFFNSFAGSGPDTFSQGQKFVDVDKAFVQFAGITAGRAQSLFDFYAGDLEFFGAGIYSNSNTNLLAYTATFGSGFSASISMEDPVYRRNPIFFNSVIGAINANNTTPAAQQNGLNFISGGVPVAFVATAFNAQGVPVQAGAVDVTQRVVLPDFVGVLRYDQAWGSAQLMGAVHELRTGNFVGGAGLFPVNNAASPVGGVGLRAGNRRVPDTEYGFAVGGGLKLNVPQLAPGDQLWLQVAYAQGAGSYTGVFNPPGSEVNTGTFTNRFQVNQNDAVIDSSGQLNLTESYSGTIAFLHYWTPEIRQGVFGTHGQVLYDSRLRTAFGSVGGTATQRGLFDPTFRSYGITYVGSNLIYSPVRDLDIGVEVVYSRLDIRGRAFDTNRPAIIGGVNQRTVTTDDTIQARFRIQRDF